MISGSSPYNDTLSPKVNDDTINTIDNKGLNVTSSLSTNQDSSPYNDTFSPKVNTELIDTVDIKTIIIVNRIFIS